MWVEKARNGGRLLLAEAGALMAWAFLVNRVVIHWPDGNAKTAATLLLGLALAALGAASALTTAGKRRFPSWAWAVLLGAFAIGEIHRAWLRNTYRASSTDSSPLRPITTTDLQIRRFGLEVAALGARRVRVVSLSDLHVTDGTDPAYVARVHGALRELEPDLLFMTGDFVSKPERIPALARWFDGMPPPRFGTFAVLGNHDYWTGEADAIRALLRAAGATPLAGNCSNVDIPGAPRLRVCGTEAPWGPALTPPSGDSAVATLVLSHTPDNVYALAERGATAVFAGHTHGGQWRIPWLGAMIVPSYYGRRFDQGHFVVDGTHLFVSAGVGADAPNLRLWCPPDLVVVDITEAKPQAAKPVAQSPPS